MKNELILVDEFDNELGFAEKMEAHQKGLLHRAVSVFIFNDEGKLLLQKRAMGKYHSPGLWTNTACSHPLPGETNIKAATRRLQEEMGLVCDLNYAFQFIYKVEFENGLIEHELDHVFIGYCNDEPKLNTMEAMDSNWFSESEIMLMMKISPEKLTEWFKICFEMVMNHVKKDK